MKTLILSLMMAISQASFAGGSQVGTLDNSSVGNFKTADNGSVGNMGGSRVGTVNAANNGSGTMGGSSVGNFKSARIGFGNMGIGQGNMDNSQMGTLAIVGGAEANGGNSVGTMKLVGGAEANFGSGGGGILVEYRAIKSGSHEI